MEGIYNMDDKKLVNKLSKLFTNKKFLESIINSERYGRRTLKYSYGEVLKYYICTRDENFNQTFDEIMEKVAKIETGKFEEIGLTKEKVLSNVRENGFITSAMNGNKAERVKKYGLDYFDKLNNEERKELDEARNALNQLEELLEKSFWVKEDEKIGNPQSARQIFFSVPGPKTIHYALSASPERLYRGPLNGIERFPIVYGETKEDFYFRFIEHKINEKKPNISNKEYEKIITCMHKVYDMYCKNLPIIAMVSNKQAFNTKFFNATVEEDILNGQTLEELSKENGGCFGYNDIREYLSENDSDASELNNKGNLVTVAEQIPKEGLVGFINMMDYYEIEQVLGKEKGAKIGDYVSRHKENNDILILANCLKNVKNNEDLEHILEKIDAIKQDFPSLKEKIENKYGKTSKEQLKEKLMELKEKREEIFNRDFPKKERIRDKEYFKRNY